MKKGILIATVLSLVISLLLVGTASAVLIEEVNIDIKPGSCPNPLDVNSKGVLPVAILGAADLDVNDIVPDSIVLADVPPIRWACEDVDGDGIEDLTLKFDKQAIVAAIGSVADGDVVELTLTGERLDGSLILGEDVVIVIMKGMDGT